MCDFHIILKLLVPRSPTISNFNCRPGSGCGCVIIIGWYNVVSTRAAWTPCPPQHRVLTGTTPGTLGCLSLNIDWQLEFDKQNILGGEHLTLKCSLENQLKWILNIYPIKINLKLSSHKISKPLFWQNALIAASSLTMLN